MAFASSVLYPSMDGVSHRRHCYSRSVLSQPINLHVISVYWQSSCLYCCSHIRIAAVTCFLTSNGLVISPQSTATPEDAVQPKRVVSQIDDFRKANHVAFPVSKHWCRPHGSTGGRDHNAAPNQFTRPTCQSRYACVLGLQLLDLRIASLCRNTQQVNTCHELYFITWRAGWCTACLQLFSRSPSLLSHPLSKANPTTPILLTLRW